MVAVMADLPPGPRLPGAAQAGLWGLRYPAFTAAARRRHGSTYSVKLGTTPRSVVTTDRSAIRTLLTGDPLDRPAMNDVVRPLIGDRSVLQLAPQEHLVRRRLLLPPLHGESIREYADLVEELTDDEVARWSVGRPVVALDVAQRISLEVIMRAVLGISDPGVRARLRVFIDDLLGYPVVPLRRRLPGTTAHRAARVPHPHTLRADIGNVVTPAVMTYFTAFKARSPWNLLTRPFFAIHDRLLSLFDELISATRRDPALAGRRDILALLVQATGEDGNGLGDDDLRDELFALLSAGHETTAATIAWALDYLAHDPALRATARAAARDGDTTYLTAVTREALRIRPPLPIASNRTLTMPLHVGRHTVPAGTPILIDAYGLHRDPEIYPDPERFDPGRFLGAAERPPHTWLPFGGGAHRCVGAALAEMETAIVLGQILRRFDIEPLHPQPAEPIRQALILAPSGGAAVVPH